MTTYPAKAPPGKTKAKGSTGLDSDFISRVERRVQEEAARRAERRRELREKEITADVRIVAWIDILGFSQRISDGVMSRIANARTQPNLG